jgi:prefoldin alpha subunit
MKENNEYQELQVLDYQLRQFQTIIETIEGQLIEASTSRDALIELKNLKGDEEVLFPISNGVFIKGKMSDNKMLRINVGTNIVVEKTLDDSIIMMDKQVTDLQDYKIQLDAQMNDMIRKAEALQLKLSQNV